LLAAVPGVPGTWIVPEVPVVGELAGTWVWVFVPVVEPWVVDCVDVVFTVVIVVLGAGDVVVGRYQPTGPAGLPD